MPFTDGSELTPPLNMAPLCPDGGVAAPPDGPLTHTPAKSLGTVPLGQAAAGAAFAHKPPAAIAAHTPTPRARPMSDSVRSTRPSYLS